MRRSATSPWRIVAELVPLFLVLACLAGALGLVIEAHRRHAGEAPPEEGPVVVAAAPEVPAQESKPTPDPEPTPPPPPEPEDPTPRVVAEYAAQAAEQRAEAEAADRRAASLEAARAQALADAEGYRRREMLVRRQADALTRQAERMEAEVEAMARRRDVLARHRDIEKSELSRAFARARDSYAILPYRGAHGTWQRPIAIECRDGRAILQPDGPSFSLLELSAGFGRSSAIVAAVTRAIARAEREVGPDGMASVPYVLFVIRPDGIRAYYDARTCLERLGIAFGYELVDADVPIDYPDLADPSAWPGGEALARRDAGNLPGRDLGRGSAVPEPVKPYLWQAEPPAASRGGPDLRALADGPPIRQLADPRRPGLLDLAEADGSTEPPGRPRPLNLDQADGPGGASRDGIGLGSVGPDARLVPPRPGGLGLAEPGRSGISDAPTIRPGLRDGTGRGARNSGVPGTRLRDPVGGERSANRGFEDATPATRPGGVSGGATRSGSPSHGGSLVEDRGSDVDGPGSMLAGRGSRADERGSTLDQPASGFDGPGAMADLHELRGEASGGMAAARGPVGAGVSRSADTPSDSPITPDGTLASGDLMSGRPGTRPTDPGSEVEVAGRGLADEPPTTRTPSLPALPTTTPGLGGAPASEAGRHPALATADQTHDSQLGSGGLGSGPASGSIAGGSTSGAPVSITDADLDARRHANGGPGGEAGLGDTARSPGESQGIGLGLGLGMPPTPGDAMPAAPLASAASGAEAAPTSGSRSLAVTVACRPEGVTIQPGGYRLSRQAIETGSLLISRLRAVAREEQARSPGEEVRPVLVFLVEPGGQATFWEARRRTTFAGLDWPAALRMAESGARSPFTRGSLR